MTNKENGERHVSTPSKREEQLHKAVRNSVEDWVAAGDIAVQREGDDIVADKDELIENICAMITIAVDEAAE